MTMQQTDFPYALPRTLKPDLARVLAYWEGLKRGSAEIPFWDDVKLTDLPDLAERIALIDVFEGPERFRLAVVGEALEASQPAPVSGRFLDEIDLESPLDYLRAQCAAAVERGGPTYVETVEPGAHPRPVGGRLVLPLWGEGQIHMLLTMVE